MKQASKQASKQAINQSSRQAGKQASKQASKAKTHTHTHAQASERTNGRANEQTNKQSRNKQRNNKRQWARKPPVGLESIIPNFDASPDSLALLAQDEGLPVPDTLENAFSGIDAASFNGRAIACSTTKGSPELNPSSGYLKGIESRRTQNDRAAFIHYCCSLMEAWD